MTTYLHQASAQSPSALLMGKQSRKQMEHVIFCLQDSHVAPEVYLLVIPWHANLTFPSISSLSSPIGCILRLRGIFSIGEASNSVGLLRPGWPCGVWESHLCGVFSTERSFKLPPGVCARAGVPPFCNGVLGGRFLSKNSGESGPPNRTVFFLLLTADFTVKASSPANTAKCTDEALISHKHTEQWRVENYSWASKWSWNMRHRKEVQPKCHRLLPVICD